MEHQFQVALLAVVGALTVLTVPIRELGRRFGLPPMVGFIALGLLLRVLDDHFDFLGPAGHPVLHFLASLGVVLLLFRVGLESNLHGLIRSLPHAAPIWLGNVALSGLLGYFAARMGLGLALVPSLFVATALTATSVAVSISVWRDAGLLASRDGELLLDVAGLDDVSAVVLMAMVIAAAPAMLANGGVPPWPEIGATAALLLAKALGLGAVCLIFAKYLEQPFAAMIGRFRTPDPFVLVIGIGIVVATIAAGLGFSLALGALFAGLVFSSDPRMVRLETLFEPVYDLFTPFFFISVGLALDPSALGLVGLPALLILAAAVVGKLIGAGLPALAATDRLSAAAIAVSMVPRAEIAMVVATEALAFGPAAMPPEVFSGLVLTAAVTCLTAPPLVRLLLARRPER